MTDFIQITVSGDRITSPMPADETVVEVQLKDGTVTRAWFSCNISEPGDFDFLPALTDDEPDMDAESIADQIAAWRNLN